MPLISCKIYLVLTWSANCVLSGALNQAKTFAIANKKFFLPILTLQLQFNSR